MDIVVVMDGPETVAADTDTSFALMLAAAERGHRCWHCRATDVSLIDGRPHATARPATPDEASTPPLRLGEAQDVDLTSVDVVLLRTDPPFDSTYLHLTLLLDALAGKTLVVNAPRGLRDANEKLYACRFGDVIPPTIVTADMARLRQFAVAHAAVVVKPIDGHGGRGVLVVRPDDENAESILDSVTRRGAEPVVAQRYLPGVRDGDKRILLLDGRPLGGAVLRRPAGSDFRANICVGGSVEVVDLDDDDRRIIAAVAPALRADGLVFVGIDVVDGHLTEVNVTSPTGIRQLARLSGTRPDLDVIRWLEGAVRARG